MVRAPPCHGGGQGFEPLSGRLLNNFQLQLNIWGLSSAGRASALQAEGHRFEPYRFHILKENGEIAQLARAHGSYPWCRGFKSLSRYYLRSGSRRCFHFFCASSDERSHGKFTAVLARTGNFVWLYEEHRDNDRTKFWSMSCSRNPRR